MTQNEQALSVSTCIFRSVRNERSTIEDVW